MKTVYRWVALAAVATVLVAACSSDDDGSTEAGRATSSTTETTAASTTTTEPRPVPSEGCGTATEAVAKERRTIDIDGTERWYLTTSPARAADDEPMPLVVDFHGLAEGAEIAATMSDMAGLSEQDSFAIVYPNGTGSPVRWDLDLDAETNPDLQFVTALLDEAEADLCIDTTRVYAMGLSMGAMMSSLVACTMNDRFAAIAPVAGVQFYDDCEPGRPVPVLAFHGTADPILLFNGGVDTGKLDSVLGRGEEGGSTTTTSSVPTDLEGEGYPESVRNWAENNGCKGSADEDVSEAVIHRTYECPPGADVEFYIVEGGGHSWPGSEFSKAIEQVVGPTTFDIDATELAWAFLQQFRLPA
jgi:polyhydroxybutyrate depolymerase